MYPVLLRIGMWELRSYGVVVAIAVLIVVGLVGLWLVRTAPWHSHEHGRA